MDLDDEFRCYALAQIKHAGHSGIQFNLTENWSGFIREGCRWTRFAIAN